MATTAVMLLHDNKPNQTEITEILNEENWAKAYLMQTSLGQWVIKPKRPYYGNYKNVQIVKP